jgi:hypothetical protein
MMMYVELLDERRSRRDVGSHITQQWHRELSPEMDAASGEQGDLTMWPSDKSSDWWS